jgi:hypothetical protein
LPRTPKVGKKSGENRTYNNTYDHHTYNSLILALPWMAVMAILNLLGAGTYAIDRVLKEEGCKFETEVGSNLRRET